MQPRPTHLALLLVVSPLLGHLESPDPDSAQTTLRWAGGAGTYGVATHGCNTPEHFASHDFNDQAIAIEHSFKPSQRAGLSIGRIETAGGPSGYYFNPRLSTEDPAASFGFGLLVGANLKTLDKRFDSPIPTGHLQLGYSRFYLRTSYMEELPLFSGAGTFSAGMGGTMAERVGLFAGVSLGRPYDALGYELRMRCVPLRNWALGANIRLNSANTHAGPGERSVSLELRRGFPSRGHFSAEPSAPTMP